VGDVERVRWGSARGLESSGEERVEEVSVGEGVAPSMWVSVGAKCTVLE
jgi:hypothetical protein